MEFSEDSIKKGLKQDFKAHITRLIFHKSLVQVVSDTLYKKPFQQIVIEAYQEVLDDFKNTLCITHGEQDAERECN